MLDTKLKTCWIERALVVNWFDFVNSIKKVWDQKDIWNDRKSCRFWIHPISFDHGPSLPSFGSFPSYYNSSSLNIDEWPIKTWRIKWKGQEHSIKKERCKLFPYLSASFCRNKSTLWVVKTLFYHSTLWFSNNVMLSIECVMDDERLIRLTRLKTFTDSGNSTHTADVTHKLSREITHR